MQYQKAIQLLTWLEKFEKNNPQGNLQEFAQWFLNETQTNELPENQSYLVPPEGFNLDTDAMIGHLISRMWRFSKFYAKTAFQDLDITLEEWGFLIAAFKSKNPTKSDLIMHNLVEFTTGAAIIKRLVKIGYLEELENEQDRRSQRMKLTVSGEQVLNQLFIHIYKISKIVVGNLSEVQKQNLLSSLIQLDHFHTNIFLHQKDKSLDEILRISQG